MRRDSETGDWRSSRAIRPLHGAGPKALRVAPVGVTGRGARAGWLAAQTSVVLALLNPASEALPNKVSIQPRGEQVDAGGIGCDLLPGNDQPG